LFRMSFFVDLQVPFFCTSKATESTAKGLFFGVNLLVNHHVLFGCSPIVTQRAGKGSFSSVRSFVNCNNGSAYRTVVTVLAGKGFLFSRGFCHDTPAFQFTNFRVFLFLFLQAPTTDQSQNHQTNPRPGPGPANRPCYRLCLCANLRLGPCSRFLAFTPTRPFLANCLHGLGIMFVGPINPERRKKCRFQTHTHTKAEDL